MCILGAYVTTESRGKFSAGPVHGVSPVEILESQTPPLVLAQPVPTQHVGPIPEETPETPKMTPEETPPPLLPDRLPDSQQELPERRLLNQRWMWHVRGETRFFPLKPQQRRCTCWRVRPGWICFCGASSFHQSRKVVGGIPITSSFLVESIGFWGLVCPIHFVDGEEQH